MNADKSFRLVVRDESARIFAVYDMDTAREAFREARRIARCARNGRVIFKAPTFTLETFVWKGEAYSLARTEGLPQWTTATK